MRNTMSVCLAVCLVVIMEGGVASALERGASSIEALRFDGASYRHTRYMGGVISADVPVANTSGAWAIVAEIGAGRLSQTSGPSFDRLQVQLGARRYLGALTSLALTGGYAWYDADDDFEVGMVTLSGRQFLVSPQSPVAPYLRVNGSLQYVDPSLASPARRTSSYRMAVVEVLAGCEFRMKEGLAFVIEAGGSESEALGSGGTGFADGGLVRIAMQYDWF